MVREAFERELQRLQDEMMVMASMVESAIVESVSALKRRDMVASRNIVEQDHVINEMRYTIETDCLVAIATQQPVATDLRLLAAILDISKKTGHTGMSLLENRFQISFQLLQDVRFQRLYFC